MEIKGFIYFPIPLIAQFFPEPKQLLLASIDE
jgi:hypothetical protein